MKKIRSYDKYGLIGLWEEVSKKHKTDDAILDAIYKTYGKEQWEQKCKELMFNSPKHSQQTNSKINNDW